MQRLKNAIMKIAAISGTALMGLTAVAAGAAAATTYAIGPTADAASTTLLTTGGEAVGASVTADCTIGLGISTSNKDVFDSELEDEDVYGLMDSEVAFQGKSYNYHDEVKFALNGPNVSTSLTSNEDDYGSDVYLEATAGTMGYYYIFDESINVSTSTSSEPLEFTFLGQSMQVTSVTDQNTFVARLGVKKTIRVNEPYTVEGHTVTVLSVGDTSVLLDVDGTEYTITELTSQSIGSNFEIYVQDTIKGVATLEEGMATLWMGKDARETIDDTDPVRGGDDDICEDDLKDMDCWKWVVNGLNTSAVGDDASTTSAPTIGVISNFNVNDMSDEPITVGESYQIADGKFWVNFEELTNDDDYAKITVEYDSSVDFSTIYDTSGNALGGYGSSNQVFLIKSDQDEGFDMDATALALSTTPRTNKIWLRKNDSTQDQTDIIYYSSEGTKILAGTKNETGASFATIRYSKTKDANINITMNENANVSINLTFDIRDDNTYIADGADDIDVELGVTNDIFDAIGPTADKAEAGEVTWGSSNKQLGTKDEDQRSLYGIIIKDPDSNGDNDKFVMNVPKDNIKARLTVTGSEVAMAAIGSAKTPDEIEKADITAGSILVGGPAANKYAAEAMGVDFPTYGHELESWSDGYCYIKALTIDGKAITVVAGWDAADTQACVQKYQSGVTSFAGIM